jgi:tetratricopeptide (TPR) repeat protein
LSVVIGQLSKQINFGDVTMKGLKLAVAIFAFGTIAFAPKAEAKSLFNTQQYLVSQAVPESPNSPKTNQDVLLQSGLSRVQKGDYQGGIRDFNQLLKQDPKNTYAYVGRGLSYFGLEQYQIAKKDFDAALEITPDIAYAHYFRGLTSFILKDKPSAISDLQKAGELFKKEGNQEFAQKVEDTIKKIQES